MPYIEPKVRQRFVSHEAGTPETPGELNYLITQVCLDFLDNHKESYQTYNDIIGVLECAKLELYRRKISKYEDQKCKINGEVYGT